MEKIINIVINYANELEVLQYAKTIHQQTWSNRIILVIVENKKSNNSRIDLEAELSKLKINWRIYTPNNNLGYINGFLFGYRKYVETATHSPDWCILSNTDLIINDNSFFEKLLSVNYTDDTCCIGPSIHNIQNMTYDNPKYKKRISSKKMDTTILIHKRPYLSLLYLTLGKYKAKKNKTNKQESQHCYALQGCFIAFRNDFVQCMLKTNYEAFLFSEENYISELALLNNKRCYYNANVEIVHNEKTTTSLIGFKNRAKYFYDSLSYIRRRFY